ncbi:MAG TPA: VCBS repeat-containing protein [Thermoanaerobaculia bacterium]|jgi:hypothetical protein
MSARRRYSFVLSSLALTFSAAAQIALTGPGPGMTPTVKVFENGFEVNSFNASPSTTSGVTVAFGDVDGDGAADLIAGTETAPASVKVFSGTTNLQLGSTILPFPQAFTGGVYVASGDVNGDGFDDIVIGAGEGSGVGPRVQVYDGVTRQVTVDFFAYDLAFTGGVRVASADYNGDRIDDIITGAGPGGGPRVRVFSGANGALLADFFAFTESEKQGLFVAAGDTNNDGKAEIATALDEGAIPNVRVYNGANNATLMNFIPYSADFLGGVRVGIGQNADRKYFIFTATGPGTAVSAKMWSFTSPSVAQTFAPYGSFNGGAYVAGYDPRPTATITSGDPICGGANAKIHVALTGVPPWTMTWNDGFTTATSSLPHFRQVNTPGVYSIVNVADRHHLHGKTEGSATIEEGTAPAITQHPQSQTVNTATGASLTAAATGAAAFQWYRGIPPSGTLIPGATNSSHATGPLTQTTWFYVRASDDAGCFTDSNPAQITAKPARPTSVVATATSTTSVTVSWPAVPVTASYEIDRKSGSGGWELASAQSGTTFVDSGRTAGLTYLYRVRALAADGVPSDTSGAELATTIMVTDPALTLGVTPVKAAHVTELRAAVNSVRAAALLSPFSFTDASLAAGTTVKAVHVTELRTALAQARTALGLFTAPFTDSTLTAGTTKVKRLHVVELRNGAF